MTSNIFVNIQFQDETLLGQLDSMVSSDESDRSKFIRKLIRDEWGRRNPPTSAVMAKARNRTARVKNAVRTMGDV